jgi:hypothetical protein
MKIKQTNITLSGQCDRKTNITLSGQFQIAITVPTVWYLFVWFSFLYFYHIYKLHLYGIARRCPRFKRFYLKPTTWLCIFKRTYLCWSIFSTCDRSVLYLWVFTLPLLDCSEFGNFVITLIYGNFLANTIKLNTRHESGLNIHSLVKEWHRSL